MMSASIDKSKSLKLNKLKSYRIKNGQFKQLPNFSRLCLDIDSLRTELSTVFVGNFIYPTF